MNHRQQLIIAIVISIGILAAEVLGGWLSNSLALLSDAGHVLTDLMSLILALLAASFAGLPANKKNTYGFYRLEILSALINGSLLIIIAVVIMYQAMQRLFVPQTVESQLMLAIAVVGLLGNLLAAYLLSRGSHDNLNIKGAFLHILSDAAASCAVILGGIIIYFFHWYYIDPLLGIVIALLILRGALDLVQESATVLLEASPANIKTYEVVKDIKSIEGVKNIHDLHIWTIASGINAISAHFNSGRIPKRGLQGSGQG